VRAGKAESVDASSTQQSDRVLVTSLVLGDKREVVSVKVTPRSLPSSRDSTSGSFLSEISSARRSHRRPSARKPRTDQKRQRKDTRRSSMCGRVRLRPRKRFTQVVMVGLDRVE